MRRLPAALALALPACLAGPCAAQAFAHLTVIRAVEGAAAPPRLEGQWLVGHGGGVSAVAAKGGVTAQWVTPAPVTALATPPPGGAPAHPLAPVAAATTAEGSGSLWRLDPGGAMGLLAGNPGPGGPAFRDGLGPAARFGRIIGLALAPDGRVLVADAGNGLIRCVTPEGRVTTLAGEPLDAPGRDNASLALLAQGPRDGTGPAASFGLLRGLALEPGTGQLYVADLNAIRRVSPRGKVTTVLGVWSAAALPPEGPIPRGVACLDHPGGLQFLDGRLLITDQQGQALRAFDPATRTVATLVVLPPASPTPPRVFGVSTRGACLVGQEAGLDPLDLAPLLNPGKAP